MAKPSRFAELVSTVTRDVVEHPRDLSRLYAEKLGISRAGVARYVVKLENEGWIARSGPSTHPVFSPGYRRRVQKLYDIAGLAEDIAWTHDFRPYLNLKPNVVDLVGHGFTEMLNNAIDHSAGASVFWGVSEFLCVRLASTLPASGEGHPVPASRFPIVTQHSR